MSTLSGDSHNACNIQITNAVADTQQIQQKTQHPHQPHPHPSQESDPTPRTGLFFDSRCLLHQANYNHIESYPRLLQTYRHLVEDGLWQQAAHLQVVGSSLLDTFSSVGNYKLVYGSSTHGLQDCEGHQRYMARGGKSEAFRLPYHLEFSVDPGFSPVNSDASGPLPLVDEQDLLLVHTPQHLIMIKESADYPYGEDELDSETEDDPTLYPDCQFITADTYVNMYSYDAAITAVSGVVHLTHAVCRGQLSNAFAVIRPPGHHAGVDLTTITHDTTLAGGESIQDSNSNDDSQLPTTTTTTTTTTIDTDTDTASATPTNEADGFCLFNNIAIAARVALRDYPSTIRRILIVDFDVHHGNGTQNCFYADNSVLFFSIHSFYDQFFPQTGTSGETGRGTGEGYTVNLPLTTFVSDYEYLLAFSQLFLPIARSFQPDLVLISAGFDSLQGDPVGNMHVTPAFVYLITSALQSPSICPSQRVVAALEGGYNPTVVAHGTAECIRSLLGEPPAYIPDQTESIQSIRTDDVVLPFYESLYDAIQVQSAYWPCLHSVSRLSPEEAIATWRSMELQNILDEFTSIFS